MSLETLDVRTAEGYTLKVGVCARSGSGPSILILPGLYSHMGWYLSLAEELATLGSPAFLLDRRGAGISEGRAGHLDSWRHVVDDILRVVARMRQLRPAVAVCALGISLGSAILLATSLLHPDCFQRQAALSPGLATHAVPLRRRIRLAYQGLARPHALNELPFTMEQLSDREDVRRELWSDPLRTRLFTSRFLVEVFRMQRFVRRGIDRLRVPLLALLAEKDSMVDNEVVLDTLQRARSAPVRVEIFEGAHHVLPASVPLADLVGRAHHWFTAPLSSLDRRFVIQRAALGA
jgi:alpha-beta hydrolase superfamily lysophospholipase